MKFATSFADHPTLEPAYKAELQGRLLHELAESPQDFDTLVKRAEGAYPTDVLHALQTLKAKKRVSQLSNGLWTRSRTLDEAATFKRSQHSPIQVSSDGFPEPHPLDFDWRFTPSTATALTKKIVAGGKESAAILGAPTLYKYLVDSGFNVRLFDKNPQVIEHLRTVGYSSVTQCNLLRLTKFTEHFQWVIADPPWYIEYYYAFLKAARKLLVPEGRMLLSVLSRLTRPSASTDRAYLLDCAMNLGFDLIEVNPGVLHYVSPPFEIEALRAEGIAIDNWRSGDLFSFILRTHKLQKLRLTRPAKEEKWQAVQLGQTTIKIKVRQQQRPQDFDYQPVSPSGGVHLRSVSRRSPVRSRIDLWTSRNIALTVRKSRVVAEALQKLSKGEPLHETLASISYEYQLSEQERTRLQELLSLLMRDAGLI